MSISHEELKRLLHYDPETGVWTWLVYRGRATIGKRAGSMHSLGYLLVMISGKNYRSARLAWFYMTGRWPAHFVDHKNGNSSDDCWKNLREANAFQNAANAKRNSINSSGYKGVHQNKAYGMFYAQIRVRGKQIFLGSRKTAEEARDLYAEAAKRLHGEFARVE